MKRILQRIESRGGKYWAELYHDKWGYSYSGNGIGGSFGKDITNDSAAIEYFEKNVIPIFQADANSTLKRIM